MTHGQTTPHTRPRDVDLGDPDLNARIADGMAHVEELLKTELNRGEEFLRDKVTHLPKAGGKRFRPLMALLASEYGPRPGSDDVVRAAVIVEMVHIATLYHDDVMDEADRRRGVDSANHRWSNSVAILAGDVLLAHASRLMSELDTATVAHFAETFEQLVTGQMRETVGPAAGINPVEHYMDVIREKTGVLIASAGYLGALHSGATQEHVDALYKVGGHIGLIFQIVDDMIDIFSDPEESGKTPGTDLREGVFTLPVLLAMEEDTDIGAELRALLTGPLTDDDSVDRALDLLARSHGRERTYAVVQEQLALAEEQFRRLPDVPATRALRRLSEYTIARVG